MLSKLTKKLVKTAIEDNKIDKESYEEYCYGINMLFNFLINEITIIFFGCIFNMLLEMLGFWFVYQILRKYAGGFHFSTALRCYLSLCIMCPIVYLLIRYTTFTVPVWSTITVISLFIIFVFSPVAAVNKPLDDREKEVFAKIVRILVLSVMTVFILMTIFNFYTVSKIITLSVTGVMLFLMAGKVHLKFLEKKKMDCKKQ